MIGYGGEDDHFVAELTYNYSVRDYDVGNSHIATIIHSPQAFKKYSTNGVKITTLAGVQSLDVTSPSGYTFRIDNRYGITRPGHPENEMIFLSENKAGGGGGVLLASSDMAKTSEFWKNVAQMDCEYGLVTKSVQNLGLEHRIRLEYRTRRAFSTQIDHQFVYLLKKL